MTVHTLSHYSPPPDRGLSVIYADDCLVVLDKPSGLLSVPGRGEDRADCLASRAQARFADALIVHRLDMSTSGLIVMGRGPQWQRALSVAFQDRLVHKRYQAVVAGLLSPESGVVDLPLLTDWPNRPRQKVDHELGKRAQTRYRLLAHDVAAVTSRVELEPITGRTHQLRVHMQQLGHPILGDDLYADEVACRQAPRLLLHACLLELVHPRSGERLVLQSPVPF